MVLGVWVPSAAAQSPAYSFRNPFHPEQCEWAIRFGQEDLARNPASRNGRLVLAEGLLCRGLEDDPAALTPAISALRQIVAEDPAAFFPQLELADAVRKRFPLSEEARVTLQAAGQLLQRAHVGSARDQLGAYVEENLQAIRGQRHVLLPLLRKRAAGFLVNSASSAETVEFANLLALTGSNGLACAIAALDTYLTAHQGDPVVARARAELSRDCPGLCESAQTCAGALSHLCGTDEPGTDCGPIPWPPAAAATRTSHTSISQHEKGRP